MDLTDNSGNGARTPDPNVDGMPDADIYDIAIIGAGPTGLYGAFYAGMRQMKTLILDALPEAGGQLTALYPEKYIYDAPGYPKIISKDLVKCLVEQAIQWDPALRLDERVLTLTHLEDGTIKLATSKGEYLTRTAVICGGVGAFAPN